MRKLLILIIGGLLLAYLAVQNGLIEVDLPVGEPPAAEMLPDLPGYKTVEGQELTDFIAAQAEGAQLLQEQPQLAATVATVDEIIGCYQEIGAARSRLYRNETNPLSAGVVAIADRNTAANPLLLFGCLTQDEDQPGLRSQSFAIEPCSGNYTLPKDGNEFYVIYAGTTQEICNAFCRNLEGCPTTELK